MAVRVRLLGSQTLSSPPPTTVAERYGPNRSLDLICAAVPDGSHVLDVGCATGYLASRLGRKPNCTLVGVERDASAAAEAEARYDDVIIGDIESPEVRQHLTATFDVVVLADVLEHLRDPLDTLRFVRSLLNPRGIVLVSIPNVVVWRARLSLTLGRFDYADSGIFDRTHLRFFTRRTALQLARDAGFCVSVERFAPDEPPFPLKLRRFLSQQRLEGWIARLSERWPELFALQIVLTLTQPGPPGMSERLNPLLAAVSRPGPD